jgi:hypothetical protein
MPGSHTMGGVKPGLAAIQEDIKNSFLTIGNKIDSVSGEYAMGGVATQNPPMKNVTAFSAYTGSSADYSTSVSGSITVYINDEGDTVSLSGSDFDSEIANLYRAIMKLSDSTTGADAASDQASAYAADAQKALVSKYYQKLSELNKVEDQEEELSNSIVRLSIEKKNESGKLPGRRKRDEYEENSKNLYIFSATFFILSGLCLPGLTVICALLPN